MNSRPRYFSPYLVRVRQMNFYKIREFCREKFFEICIKMTHQSFETNAKLTMRCIISASGRVSCYRKRTKFAQKMDENRPVNCVTTTSQLRVRKFWNTTSVTSYGQSSNCDKQEQIFEMDAVKSFQHSGKFFFRWLLLIECQRAFDALIMPKI